MVLVDGFTTELQPAIERVLAGGAGSKQIFKLLFWNKLGSNFKLTKFWSCLHAKILEASDQVISQWSWVETSEQIDNEVNKGQVRK